MPIPLGILAAAGFRAAGGSYELIETITVGSASASVTFSGLATYASTYKHLQIRTAVRSTNGSQGDTIGIRLNADTATNYSTHLLYGNGSSVQSFGEASSTYVRAIWSTGNNSTSGAFGAGVIDILDPYSTSKNKTLRGLTGATGESQIRLTSGAWLNTNSVTSLTIFSANGASLATDSRFSIYGLRSS